MKPYEITLLPGDGIGPEILKATVTVLEATGLPFIWDVQELKAGSDGRLPRAVIESIERTRLAIKGPTETTKGSGHRSLNVQLREYFNLYANVRPVRSVAAKKTRYSDTPFDFVIFREGVEDFYCGTENLSEDGETVTMTATFTRKGCERIARYAFDYAKKNGRMRVTVLHKSNISKLAHGMFLREAQKVGLEYPSITCDDYIVDNGFMQIVMNPNRFDCILTTNFIGDILSDMCAGFVGGLGLVSGLNVGDGCAVAEAPHGTAPDIAGQNIANPSSLILSSADLLDHIGERGAAKRIRKAQAIALEHYPTRDLGVTAYYTGTQEFGRLVAQILRNDGT